MALLEYGIGGNEVKIDASEAFANIPENRSLIIEQLTAEEPVSPEAVKGLSSLDDVFRHFNPNLDIEFENEEGEPVKENFKFGSVADFSVRNMTEQSPFLRDKNMQKEFYQTIIKQLRSNKVLQRALNDPASKEAFIDALRQAKDELTVTKQ